jgi:hypothetical protein
MPASFECMLIASLSACCFHRRGMPASFECMLIASLSACCFHRRRMPASSSIRCEWNSHSVQTPHSGLHRSSHPPSSRTVRLDAHALMAL